MLKIMMMMIMKMSQGLLIYYIVLQTVPAAAAICQTGTKKFPLLNDQAHFKYNTCQRLTAPFFPREVDLPLAPTREKMLFSMSLSK